MSRRQKICELITTGIPVTKLISNYQTPLYIIRFYYQKYRLINCQKMNNSIVSPVSRQSRFDQGKTRYSFAIFRMKRRRDNSSPRGLLSTGRRWRTPRSGQTPRRRLAESCSSWKENGVMIPVSSIFCLLFLCIICRKWFQNKKGRAWPRRGELLSKRCCDVECRNVF